MESYVIAEGYKKSRRQLAILIKILKKVAEVAIAILPALL